MLFVEEGFNFLFLLRITEINLFSIRISALRNIQVLGRVVSAKGFCALNIVDYETGKHMDFITPKDIQFSPESREFSIEFEFKQE